MKNKIKNYAFGALVLLFGIIPFTITVVEGVRISPDNNISAHIVRLYKLTVGGVQLRARDNFLQISQGIVAGNIGSSNKSESQLASIGGGSSNIVSSSDYAGIAGGSKNIIQNGKNSLIGGGNENHVGASDAVIVGGQHNEVNGNGGKGVVLGGQHNKVDGDKGVVLGGQRNTAGELSLVMGSNATGVSKSFSWNADAQSNQARIDAESGILIGTVEPIAGVNLVVNGAVKLSSNDSTSQGVAGEIRVISGCFYAYDGLYKHLINQGETTCDVSTTVNNQTCDFGNVKLQAGDQVIGYNNILASQNSSKKCESKKVTCSEGKLLTDNSDESYEFPYCYEN